MIKQKLLKYFEILLFSIIFSSSVNAEEEQIKRMSFEFGGGYNVTGVVNAGIIPLPAGQGAFLYTLPVLEDTIDLSLTHASNGFPGGLLNINTVGARYYSESVFYNFGIGVSYLFNPVDFKIGFYSPAVVVGIGKELKITDSVFINGVINTGYPSILKLEVNARGSF